MNNNLNIITEIYFGFSSYGKEGSKDSSYNGFFIEDLSEVQNLEYSF